MSSVGLFHVVYHTTPSVPGAVSLTLNLLVNTPARKITGHARLFQATNPPLDQQYDVFGSYTVIDILLQGAPMPIYLMNLTGHAHDACFVTTSFELQGKFEGGWQQGSVNYRYLDDGVWHQAAQTIQAQETVSHSPHRPIIPLYAAALQQASATGNLAELKQLAVTAQAQLDQSDDIRQALGQLNAHIAERENTVVSVPPYGVAVQQAIGSGDLAQLKQLAQQIEQQISQSAQLAPALAELKQHIGALDK
ncbi:MAG: hypothetical protein RI925_2347 [Pseudomonadota bacterium]|jgi:hypothetical protein